jgi:hypothetical protein
VKLQHIPERILNNSVILSTPHGPTAGEETVEREDILQFLSRHGSLMDYEDILTTLWNISKRQERVGRTVLCSLLSCPLSEAQIRYKLSILKRCGCVAVGVKKQGTTITPIGIQVLQSIREKLIN